MNINYVKLTGMVIAFNTAMFITASVFADDEVAVPVQAASYEQGMDWVQHTRLTLDRLKSKLVLSATQNGAWDSWSRGVLADARMQTEQKNSMREERETKGRSMEDETTPERMARGIARLREENSWMQKHLTQLEAAHARTTTFYNSLSANQKTIFDMFWREMHHKMKADEDGAMHDQCMH